MMDTTPDESQPTEQKLEPLVEPTDYDWMADYEAAKVGSPEEGHALLGEIAIQLLFIREQLSLTNQILLRHFERGLYGAAPTAANDGSGINFDAEVARLRLLVDPEQSDNRPLNPPDPYATVQPDPEDT